ncbi:MAG: right-handed parallel beta-helix repeat-containing protein [Thermoplasmatota archaeon]
MMLRKGTILTLSVLLLLAGFLPLITNAEGGPPTRAPALKKGHITSDENWFENISGYALENVVIEKGVTVTVGPGVPLWFFQDSFLYVDGTLIVKGLEGDVIEFKALIASTTWGMFQINETGRVDLQNFTVTDVSSNVAVYVRGEDCVIKNGEVHGGFQNILLESKGGHLIENIDLYEATNFGISLNVNDRMCLVRNIRVFNPGLGAIAAVQPNGTFEHIYCENSGNSGLWVWQRSRNILFRDFEVTWTSFSPSGNGIYFYGISNEPTKIRFEDGKIEKCGFGVYFQFSALDVVFKNVRVLDSVNSSIYAETGTQIEATFIDCDLRGNEQTISLDGSTSSQSVEFINTTWASASPLDVINSAYLNISWYLDVLVTNGIGEPLNTELRIFPSGGGSPIKLDLPKGIIEKVPVKERRILGGYRPLYFYNDYQFQPLDHPGNLFKTDGILITNYTFWDVMLDLKPDNSMPDTLSLMEDDWYELDLYDYFSDPEEQPLKFEFEHSDDINLVQTGGKGSGDIKMKNQVPDWYGTGWVLITATDMGMNETSKNVTINVQSVNDPPRFTEPLPVLVLEEDSWTYFNFTGKVMDVEGDPLELSFPEDPNYTVEFNSTTMNVTIWPADNYFGMLEVEVNLSDGDAWAIEALVLNVTPVNDLPTARVMYGNDTELPYVNYDDGSPTGLMVYEIVLDEDTSVDIWIDAEDVDSEDLTYGFIEGTVRHGTVEVETYEIEVIVNETTNETGTEEVIVPMNFTYTPDENDFAGDLVKFLVGDGEGNTTVWVWFHVLPVNDPIQFDVPVEWNVTAIVGVEQEIDLADLIMDVDGDEPMVSTSSDFISVNGTVLSLLYTDGFIGTEETVTVTVSDGETEKTATLLVKVTRPSDDDDDDDVEPTLGEPKVSGKGDKWVVEVEGSEGQELWVVVEDEDGNRTSYKMTYQDGKYRAEIPKEDAEEGFAYWISDSEDGDPIDNSLRGNLPSIKEKEEDEFPWLVILLVAIIFALLVVILILVLRSKGGEEEYEE